MRRFLFSILFFSLLAGCSVIQKIGPHRIDVQQGNALDPESVARLKLGLNRSQVRFLLGTPLVVDPFHSDRWDYVYVFYEAGRLVEQKRITLFFDGDVLARIEGDVPAAGLADQPAEPMAPAVEGKPVPVSEPVPAAPVSSPVKQAPESLSPATPSSSIVQPLPSPKNVPEYVDPRLLVEPESSPNDGAAVLPESQP